MNIGRSTSLLLGSGIDRFRARLIHADVKSIGVEKFAFVLVRVRVISSNKNRNGSWSRISSGDRIIHTGIIISERESGSEPGPL